MKKTSILFFSSPNLCQKLLQ